LRAPCLCTGPHVATMAASLEGTQQILAAYTTDPNATIHLSVEVIWNAQNTVVPVPFDQVYLNVSGPGIKPSTMVMVRSSLPAVSLVKVNGRFTVVHDPSFVAMAIRSGGAVKADQNSGYIFEQPESLISDTATGDPRGAYIGSFELPGAVAESHGSYFAHLPVVGADEEGGFQYFPSFLSETDLARSGENVIEYPQLKNTPLVAGRESLDPGAYRSYGPPLNLYWQPAVLDTSETLDNAEPLFTNTNVNVQPGDGVLEDANYTWQGTGGIDPMINSTEDTAAASQDGWTFRSGIVFGIAAGTGVAFFQEDENPILRRVAKLYRSSRQKFRKRPHPAVR
jgi:hypothetical protein